MASAKKSTKKPTKDLQREPPASFDEKCWCNPTVSEKNGWILITHKHPDGTLVVHKQLPPVQSLSSVQWHKIVGTRINAARKKKGWTSARLSQVADVAPYSLSALQRGKSGMSLPGLLRLAAALEISANELFEGIVERPNP